MRDVLLFAFIPFFAFFGALLYPKAAEGEISSGSSVLSAAAEVLEETSFSFFDMMLSPPNADASSLSSADGIYTSARAAFFRREEHELLSEDPSGLLLLLPETRVTPPAVLPPGYLPVMRVSLAYKTFDIINGTDYSLDMKKLLSEKYPFPSPDLSKPLVLILHTHATESFYEDDEAVAAFRSFSGGCGNGASGLYKNGSYAPRSSDTSKNMVHIGDIFAGVLSAGGITVLHDRTLHDLNNYEGAYTSSRESAQAYLKKYPSIKYVLDLHRDSLIKDDGTKMDPSFVHDGKDTAQVMLVIGSDASGYYHPYWKKNLSLALKYKSYLFSEDPDLVRPIYLRTGRFNQQLSAGCMLLEIGSCGSVISEAENAAVLAANALVKMILENAG